MVNATPIAACVSLEVHQWLFAARSHSWTTGMMLSGDHRILQCLNSKIIIQGVTKLLEGLNSEKACGLDELPNFILKNASSVGRGP